MITRHYFAHARKNWKDGTGSHSYRYIHFSHRSWLPDSMAAFNHAKRSLEESMGDDPGDSVEITSFSRC